MKKNTFISLFVLWGNTSITYAEQKVPPHPLSPFIHQKVELPPPNRRRFPYPDGIYAGVTGGINGSNKFNVINPHTGFQFTPLNRTSNSAQVGGSLGYLFKEVGFINQVEFQFLYRNQFFYTGTSFLGNIFKTSIKNVTGMFKFYTTFDVSPIFFPYVYLGIGFSNNKAPATITFKNGGILPLNSTVGFDFLSRAPELVTLGDPTFITTNQADDAAATSVSTVQTMVVNRELTKSSRTVLTESAGAGVRFRVSRHVMLDISYQYTFLGRLKNWRLFTATFGETPFATFKGTTLHNHALNFSFLLQPWAFESTD